MPSFAAVREPNFVAMRNCVANAATGVGTRFACQGSAASPVGMICACGPTESSSLEMVSMVNGMTAPAATRPEALFSIASSTSRGFLKPGGSAAPNESLTAQIPTIRTAGNQKLIWANHGRRAFSSGDSAFQ